MFAALVADKRDVKSAEPYSEVGRYKTRHEAEEALALYLIKLDPENYAYVIDSFVYEVPPFDAK